MTQDEIIEMAKEIAVQYGKAERFQTWTHDFMMQRLMELVAVSAATEREACAKIADSQLFNTNALLTAPMQSSAAYQIGVSIRARGNT